MSKIFKGSFNLTDIFLSSAKKYKWLFIACFTVLLLIKFQVLPFFVSELLIPIIGIIVVVFGLPLSAALRIDQLSFNLGQEYPRELVLFISLFVTYLNLTILLFLKRLIYPVSSTTSSEKTERPQNFTKNLN